jgi:hypothetical protein
MEALLRNRLSIAMLTFAGFIRLRHLTPGRIVWMKRLPFILTGVNKEPALSAGLSRMPSMYGTKEIK